MELLKNFKTFKDETVLENEDFYRNLKKGQAPRTLFITCSDSRILPNQITGTKEGELFVIRNAGNALPPYGEKTDLATAATIEYAVKVLGVKEIIICGHAHCGAIMARTDQASVPESCSYLHHYLDTLPSFESDNVHENIKTNIRCQLGNLLSYPYIKEAHLKEELDLYGWLYHFDEGHLDVLKFPSTQFIHWEGHL